MNSRGAMEGKYERVFFHLISFFTFPELIEKSTTATAQTHRTEIEMWKTSEERENEWGGKKSFRQVKMRSIFHLTFCSPRITWLQVPFQSIRMERERTSQGHSAGKKFIDNPSHFHRWAIIFFCSSSCCCCFRFGCMSFGFVISFNFIESITHLIEFLPKTNCLCVALDRAARLRGAPHPFNLSIAFNKMSSYWIVAN